MPVSRFRREPVYHVDAAWLRMDTPTNSVNITGLYLFDQPLDFNRLRAVIQHRLLRFPRFVQRIREARLPFTLPTWEPDPDFSLDAHLHRLALPAPGGWDTLLALVEDLMRVPLHPCQPLWQMYYVENFGAGSALVVRLSHALADGVALMRVMQATTDLSPDAPPEALPDWLQDAPEEEESDFLVDAVVRALDRVDDTVNFSRSVLRTGLGMLSNPSRLAGAMEAGLGGALSLGKLLLIPPDRKTALRGRCTLAKRAVASDPLPLQEIKAIGKKLGGTVNDVLLSTVTAGFRAYLLERGENLQDASIRALVPVYIRNGKEAAEPCAGNGFGLVYLDLPVGIEDSVERLKKVHSSMLTIKRSPEAAVAYGILYGLGQVPTPMSRPIVGLFGLKGTAVITNVPGPKETLYFAGAPIRRLMFWVPQPAGLAVGVSIISYAGQVTLGLACDASVIPDPERILQASQADYEEMRALAAQAAD